MATHVPTADAAATGMHGPPAGVPAKRRWTRRAIEPWPETAVVAAAAIAAFLHLRSAFFISNDDLVQLVLADHRGLSWQLLSFRVFGHFAPVNRLSHLMFLRWAHLDLGIGALAAAGLVAVLLLTLAWSCAELGLSRTRRLLVLGALGFSVAVLDAAVWMDAALHILLALIATYAIIAAHLRGLNRRSAWWHALSVVFFAAGLLTQERPAFALPLIVLVDVLLVGRGRPWRDRLVLLRRGAVPLAAMAVLAAVAAALLGGAGSTGGPTPDLVGRTILGAFTTLLFPVLVGWVPATLPSLGVQVAVASGLVVLAVLLVLRRRTNAGPLVFAAAAFLLYYGFLAFSPLLNPYTVAQNALRTNNVVYAVVPLVIALAHVQLSGRWPAEAPTGAGGAARVPGRARRSRAAVALTVTLVALAVTSAVSVDRRWTSDREAHDYVQRVAAGRAAWSGADTTVLPLFSPTSVADTWAVEWGRQEALLPLMAPGWFPAPLTDRVVIIDSGGSVRRVGLRAEAEGKAQPGGAVQAGCLRASAGSNTMAFALDRTVTGAPLFAAVTYDLQPGGTHPVTTVAAATDGQGQWASSTWPSVLHPGRHTAVMALAGDRISQVALSGVSAGASVCVTGVTVVQPLLMQRGRCYAIDGVGSRRSAVDCPDDWYR